jgi:hypothetical protein
MVAAVMDTLCFQHADATQKSYFYISCQRLSHRPEAREDIESCTRAATKVQELSLELTVAIGALLAWVLNIGVDMELLALWNRQQTFSE